jgi:predicted ATP-grasp superfamily ATP-dependent carboligase
VATRVLIVGVSARGLAESAARAGYEVAAVDGFGDLDLRASAPVVRVARAAGRFSARAAVAAARDLPCDAVVYEASLDNHPDAVRALARGRRELWGNRPAVLERARDPRLLARVAAAAGLPGPLVRLTRPPAPLGMTWLLKPLRSGGGEAIRPWRRTEPVRRGSYLQQRIGGVAGSIVFVADGRRAAPLGVSRILAGERAFGADGFRYCGNILGAAGDGQFPSDGALVARATRLARAVTAAFGLVGVNGIDFVAQRGMPYAIEVNPRYTAAMELVERAYGLSIFDIHVRACAGALPVFDFAAARRRVQGAVGKAIVYARRSFELGDSTAWLEDEDVRDISPPGTRFAPRDPICTVFAHGADAARCHAALVRRAAALYRALENREARIA